jgi:hypothetical protein
MDTMDTKLKHLQATPTQSSCPCPETELEQTEFRSVQTGEMAGNSLL